MRNQLFDYRQETIDYYLNQKIRFNIKFYYFERLFNAIVQKIIKLVNLTIDASALTKLSFKQKTQLRQDSQVIQLDQQNKTSTSQIHNAKYKIINYVEKAFFY